MVKRISLLLHVTMCADAGRANQSRSQVALQYETAAAFQLPDPTPSDRMCGEQLIPRFLHPVHAFSCLISLFNLGSILASWGGLDGESLVSTGPT